MTYKEYRFPSPDRAKQKQLELQKQFGYNFPIYNIEVKNTKFFGIVYPEGLQPKPKRTNHQLY